jgi:hypothetical protein
VTAGERLSHGSLVRASVVARLFGMRLLRLNAEVLLIPARVDEPGPAGPTGRVVSGYLPMDGARGLREAQQLLRRATRTLEAPPFDGTRRFS